MSEHPMGWTPAILAGADQEVAQTREWLLKLASLHPEAVQQLGSLEAMVGLAAHIRDTVKQNTQNPSNATGWGVAAIAVGLLADHLHPPAQLPPMVVRQDDPQFVPKVVQGLLDPANQPPRQRYADARGECSCHINPPCGWCSDHCCAEHVDHCLAGFPPPCCDGCPDGS